MMKLLLLWWYTSVLITLNILHNTYCIAKEIEGSANSNINRNAPYSDEMEPDELDELDGLHMDDFNPSHVFTFELTKDLECFYENIENIPTPIRGAYFVSHGDKMDLFVIVKHFDEHKVQTEILRRSSIGDGVFSFIAKVKGEYEICFGHGVGKGITFAIHVGVRKREPVTSSHVASLQDTLNDCRHILDDLVSEQNFLLSKTSMHMETQDDIESRVAWLTILESVFILCVTLAQIYFIRRMINNRQWV